MTDDRLSTLELLHQSEIWIDAEGNTHQIPTMEIRHARNVIRMLERNAERLHLQQGFSLLSGPGPSGDMACDAFDSMMDEFGNMDALVWLRSSGLVQALYQRIGEPVDGVQKPDLSDWNSPEDAVYDEPPDWLDDGSSSCPGYEMDPNLCRCPCYGCQHHCSAHDPEFGRPANRYTVNADDGVHYVCSGGWRPKPLIGYRHPQAARDAADYLNTLTRWEIT